MIKLIVVGSIKENYLKEAVEEYKKRLSKYTSLQIIELKDEGLLDEITTKRKECEKIEKYIEEKDYVITLEIEGKEYTSEEFAEKLRLLQVENSKITFIIGGSYGLDDKIKRRANLHLSFSKMTFPHQLFRIILLEQIYRSFKIIHNESYHK